MRIALDHVNMQYPAVGHGVTRVLHDLNFAVDTPAFLYINGPSGAGKTSLLKLLALAERPSHGHLTLLGVDMTMQPREALPQYRRRIGQIFQDFRLLDHLTIAENVGLPLKVAGEPQAQIDAKVKELLAWVGLADYHDTWPPLISGGEKQRAAIARAVINRPDIILADEPTGNLDVDMAERVMLLLEALHRDGTTIFFATHDEWLMEAFPHPSIRIEKGRVVKGP